MLLLGLALENRKRKKEMNTNRFSASLGCALAVLLTGCGGGGGGGSSLPTSTTQVTLLESSVIPLLNTSDQVTVSYLDRNGNFLGSEGVSLTSPTNAFQGSTSGTLTALNQPSRGNPVPLFYSTSGSIVGYSWGATPVFHGDPLSWPSGGGNPTIFSDVSSYGVAGGYGNTLLLTLNNQTVWEYTLDSKTLTNVSKEHLLDSTFVPMSFDSRGDIAGIDGNQVVLIKAGKAMPIRQALGGNANPGNSSIWGMNGSGVMVGNITSASSSSPGLAFSWDGQNLSFLQANASETAVATSIDDQGVIAGYVTNNLGGARASVWLPGKNYADLSAGWSQSHPGKNLVMCLKVASPYLACIEMDDHSGREQIVILKVSVS